MTDQTTAQADFFAAFAKMQGSIEGAKKDTENPFFKKPYADLSSAWQACRGQLAENDLAVIQCPDYVVKSKCVSVQTIITHKGGHSVTFRTRIPVTKHDAQGAGSAITYARRYALMAAIGIAPEDDDGNIATNKKNMTTEQWVDNHYDKQNHKDAGFKTGPKAEARKRAAKTGAAGTWDAFQTKLAGFKDPDKCTTWFNADATRAVIKSWPETEKDESFNKAFAAFDSHVKSLYGTK